MTDASLTLQRPVPVPLMFARANERLASSFPTMPSRPATTGLATVFVGAETSDATPGRPFAGSVVAARIGRGTEGPGGGRGGAPEVPGHP